MDQRLHWETVYRTKAPDAVSWYAPHLDTSLALIERSAGAPSAAVIDVGGGEATLVDDLLARGYTDVSVLDISAEAVRVARERLGAQAGQAQWLVGDITRAELPERRYDVWHDRAVFHFLLEPAHRAAYVRQVARAMRPGGSVIVATFGPEGPTKCSGLDIVRYDAKGLHDEFGPAFRLVESRTELHRTPFGTTQQFMYCFCRVE
ncbi:class I SAM-dependent methyltransferase [Massilia sp. CFBP9026]|uniref:class I SAM-dependent methyltransferase n=1 Tax=Massilia sp. CFBP9026 TaxID=3096536 RepID=UPI002A6B254F|nr:class I SAM-dependent methyltransferase [Massilia sp. CFBP9026]MDY0962047.1 class I SAM-dependent methyltransferase [Massilia sp. CFBP9026]